MTNVVQLNVRSYRQPLPQRLAQHAHLFAADRRTADDVFWLKENAEFLNIVEATGHESDEILEVYAAFYEDIETRLGEYPQYYRFLLSIALDLEDLGMEGCKGIAMCAWAHAKRLVDAELSDLQRAEAARLLSRRGGRGPDAGLQDRLRAFAARSETFAIPNKKAAYELTHIVFYLSQYGRKDPELPASALQSLTYAGLLAYLDQNYDLLAEVCVAMRYAGKTPSSIWEGAVMAALNATHASPAENPSVFDDYHAYMVANWMAGLAGQDTFPLLLEGGGMRIDMAAPPARPLRDMSHALSETRNTNWQVVRDRVVARLGPDGLQLLRAAETSTDQFEAFYEGFARAGQPGLA